MYSITSISISCTRSLDSTSVIIIKASFVSCISCLYHGNAQCVHFFSFPPRAVGHIVQPRDCHIIEHIFVPTLSVERNNEKIRFPWASNSKFVIFPQIFPCSNYKICPIIPLLFPVSNGDSPVATTFPRSNYRGFFTTGESYCPMYTLCTGKPMWWTTHDKYWQYILFSILYFWADTRMHECLFEQTVFDQQKSSNVLTPHLHLWLATSYIVAGIKSWGCLTIGKHDWRFYLIGLRFCSGQKLKLDISEVTLWGKTKA